MAAEIDSGDLISKAAIDEVTLAKKEVDALLKSIDKLLNVSKQSEANVIVAKSVGEVAKETDKLVTSQKELEKVQKTIIEQQIKDAKAKADVKRELKEKIILGDKDAQSVRAQTSSVVQLATALAKNRAAYEALTTAEERNSKAGKKLLDNIIAQDKELKKLRESQGKHQESVGNYAKGLEGLNNVSGGVITNLKGVGASLLAIVSSPITLGFAALAGFFVAIKKAAEEYYKSSLAGEEEFNKTKAARDAFFLSYENSWINLGKVAAERIESIRKSWQSLIRLFQSDEFTAVQDEQIAKAEEIADKEATLSHEHRQDLLDDARTELEVNKLMEISRAKLARSSQERIKALRDGNELLRKQEEGDIELALKDLELQRDKVQLASEANTTMDTQFDRTKSILGLTQEEIKFIGVKREEIDKLAQLEVALSKIQSDASAKRASRLKLETTLIKEIQSEDEEALKLATAMMARLKAETAKAHDLSFEDQIQFQAKQLDALKDYGMDVTAISKAINEKNAEINKEANDKKLQEEEDLQNAITDLKAQAWQTANDLANNFFDAELQRLDGRRNALETSMAAELTAAGDNANAKAAIESRYAAQMKANENEQRVVRRKKAIAEKALAAFQITINTIKAAIEVLPNYVLAGIITATGALALASVLTKPIPAFEKGVENFGGGLAVVGEKGSELIKTGDSISLSPNTATIMRLPKGTDVIPHDDTMKALAYASLGREVKVESENRELIDRLGRIENIQSKVGKKIVQAINSNAIDLVEQGSILNRHIKLKDGNSKIVRQKAMGE